MQVQGGQEELSKIQEMDQVKKVDENWHNFLIRYHNYKLLSSLEIYCKGYVMLHLQGVKKRLCSCLSVHYDDLGFLTLYMTK